jgi:hypothetical protein
MRSEVISSRCSTIREHLKAGTRLSNFYISAFQAGPELIKWQKEVLICVSVSSRLNCSIELDFRLRNSGAFEKGRTIDRPVSRLPASRIVIPLDQVFSLSGAVRNALLQYCHLSLSLSAAPTLPPPRFAAPAGI